MKKPFTKEEIKIAVKRLKNNKSPGSDGITAEREVSSRVIEELFFRRGLAGVEFSRKPPSTMVMVEGVIHALSY